MTKYDWSNVPLEVKWIATDESGLKYSYKRKPKISSAQRVWCGVSFNLIGKSEFNGNWQDSLEERPNV